MPQATILILFLFAISLLVVVFKMFKYQKKYSIATTVIGSILCALIFTLSSAYWTTDIAYDRETLKHLEFGWPIPFEVQNQSYYEPPFPWETGYAYDMASHSEIAKNFYLSLLINFLGIVVIWISLFYFRVFNRPERLKSETN